MNRRQLLAASSAALLMGGDTSSSPTDLKGDVEIVRRALALHPGLYRYSTPAEVEQQSVVLETAFVEAAGPAARYLVLSRFLATIRCGHSYCNFFNQKNAVASDLFDRKTRLPFHFIWLEGRMVVSADPSKLGVPVGSEILTVNGAPASDFLTALTPYARADGHNDAKRWSLLGVTGTDSVEYFDVFHGLVFGAPAGGIHRVTLRRVTGEEATLELPAIGLARRRAQMRQRDLIAL